MLSLVMGQPLRPAILAHYMPWYQSKPFSGSWGWHWTMNHFDPDTGEAASRFRPLIGLYDSADVDAVDCEVQLMKLSGMDGLIIDWYGVIDAQDYAVNKRNADLMVRESAKAGLKFAIIFEDFTVNELIRLGKIKKDEDFAAGRQSIQWLDKNYFGLPNYFRFEGKPLLLDFGPQHFTKDDDWQKLFDGLQHPPAFFSLLGRKPGAVGAFGWMEPQVGDAQSREHLKGFYQRSREWPSAIGIAFPRFEDIYAQAKVGSSYGEIEDRNGSTYRDTLDLALANKTPIVQIGTWNDWGEGTQIEPSVEFGYRDLEATQAARRRIDPSFRYTAEDLRVPVKLYGLRKSGKVAKSKLDLASRLLMEEKPQEAGKVLQKLPN